MTMKGAGKESPFLSYRNWKKEDKEKDRESNQD
jgi:hypothetical protein